MLADNRQDIVNAGFSFDTSQASPRLVLKVNGNSSCLGTAATSLVRCPMMYRRAPANPVVSVPIDVSSAVAGLPGVMAGVVAFNARSNSPLAQCVVRFSAGASRAA